MQYYITRNNQQLGPFTEAEVRAQLAAGTISPQDHVWWQGQQGWIPLAQSALAAPATPGLAVPPTPAIPSAATFNPTPTGKTSGMAIASLVCGCLTLLCGLLAAIPAIILGHLALGEIKKNPGYSGRGLALTGLIIGYVMTVLSIIGIAIYLTLLPSIIKQIKDQQQSGQVFTPTPSTTPDESTNSDQPAAAPTNSPDQSTNSATATPAPADQSTNSSTPSTNAPDSSTNAAPMSQ